MLHFSIAVRTYIQAWPRLILVVGPSGDATTSVHICGEGCHRCCSSTGLVSMTVPAFCRFFKKTTSKTFTKLVNEYRVVHATKLLSESNISITDICFECGFNNFSHFNKLFKEFTGKSASKYRSQILKLIQ